MSAWAWPPFFMWPHLLDMFFLKTKSSLRGWGTLFSPIYTTGGDTCLNYFSDFEILEGCIISLISIALLANIAVVLCGHVRIRGLNYAYSLTIV